MCAACALPSIPPSTVASAKCCACARRASSASSGTSGCIPSPISNRSIGNRPGFELLVRRCHVIDDFNGERYDGVASNHLCDLPSAAQIKFAGPVGHPFRSSGGSLAPAC